ncbi:MAG: DUF4436 family protein [Methylocella sp.]
MSLRTTGQGSPIRAIALGASMLAVVIAYVAMAYGLDVASVPTEVKLAGGDRPADLGVYVWPQSIDVVNATMQLRVDFTPQDGLRGDRIDAPDRDLRVMVSDGRNVHEVAFKAQQPMASLSTDLDLASGAFVYYPFDRYQAQLRITTAAALAGDSAPPPLTQAVTVWQGMAGFVLTAALGKSEAGTGESSLTIDARRSDAIIFFALAAYGAMAVLGLGSFAIGALVFLRRRKLDIPLIGALAAMVFAVPALRTALPGAPPLGGRADMLVFLWAVLAAVIGLLLLIGTWAAEGPRP